MTARGRLRTVVVAVLSAWIAVAAACSASVTDTDTPEAPRGDSLIALMGDGAWRAIRSLQVTRPNGDLVIDGEDLDLRRLIITAYDFADALADGQTVTLLLDPESSTTVAHAVVRTGTGEVWATSVEGSTGSITFTRDGAKATGTFTITLGPVPGSGAAASRSVFNGRFSITLP